ncbi:unnamed protein product [Mytilus edulis]|uniref:Uncharacterized protein n=1 Tax=Mytilus edulis TaxID=6550 RepID=A0A8S3TS45_MYTED|nr:unnamed protein product [Mytilus edulis]
MSDFDFGDPYLFLQTLFENEIELEKVPVPIATVEIPAEILSSTETGSTDVQKPDPKPQIKKKRFKRVSGEEIIALKTSGKQYQQKEIQNGQLTFCKVRIWLPQQFRRDLNMDIDIVGTKNSGCQNDILDGKLKYDMKSGLSRPTKHKEVIS